MQPTKQSFTGFEPTKGKMHGVNTRNQQTITLPKGGKVQRLHPPHQPSNDNDNDNEKSPLFFLTTMPLSKTQLNSQVGATNEAYDLFQGSTSSTSNSTISPSNKASFENLSRHLLSNSTISPSEMMSFQAPESLHQRSFSFSSLHAPQSPESTSSSVSSIETPQSPRMVLRDSTIQKQRKRNWNAETVKETPPANLPETSFTPPILNQNRYALRSLDNSYSNSNNSPLGSEMHIEYDTKDF